MSASTTASLAKAASTAGSVRGACTEGSEAGTDLMVLPADPFQPVSMWSLAMPPKGKRPPNWEASLDKFENSKKSIDTIALNQENGKPRRTSAGSMRSRAKAHLWPVWQHGTEVLFAQEIA